MHSRVEALTKVAGTLVRLKRQRLWSSDAPRDEKCNPVKVIKVPPLVRPVNGLRLDTLTTPWYSKSNAAMGAPFAEIAKRWWPGTPGGARHSMLPDDNQCA